jgi:hypothetical protein
MTISHKKNILHENYERITLDIKRETSTHAIYKSKIDNNQWIIKHPNDYNNEGQWVIHEYVASKIFNKILGENIQPKVELVFDKKTKQVLTATEKLKNFKAFNIVNEPLFPFYCVKSGCEIIARNKKFKVTKHENEASTYNGKKSVVLN